MAKALDTEMVDVLRLQLSHPVSEEDVRVGRAKLRRDGLVVGFIAVIGGVAGMALVNDLFGWTFLACFLPGQIENQVHRYRLLRVRPATPVPADVLAATVRSHQRCPGCRAIVSKGPLFCPACGRSLMITGPGLILIVLGTAATLTWVWLRI